ncbi:MAG: glucosaminidase domain-containing protein [Phycisphaerae bacterium]|nr:glucosaminidase domain-containing protein [Saprospiraceae bacterium]
MKSKTCYLVLAALCFAILVLVADETSAQAVKGESYRAETPFGGDVKSVSARIAAMYSADAPTVERFVQAAINLEGRMGIAAPVVIAIAIHESSFNSELFKNAGNPFGIQASKPWVGPSFTKLDNGQQTKFRKYSSAEEAVLDFGNFVKNRTWYADVFTCPVDDSRCVVDGLKKTDLELGYSMNPNWDESVMQIIQKVRLQELATR